MKLPNETELAQNLGVGRSSVREALKVLEAMELIDRTKDGPVIRSPGSEFMTRWLSINIAVRQISFAELIEARAVLEVALAGYAANNIDEEGLNRLLLLIETMDKSASSNAIDEYIKANVDFHVTIAAAADNRFLYQVMESVRKSLMDFQRQVYDSANVPQVSSQQHRAIYEAIRGGNPGAARDAMREHIWYMEKLYKSL